MTTKLPSSNRLAAWISKTIKRITAIVPPAGAAALALGLLLPASAGAGPKFWTGGYTGGNGSTWNNSANWSDLAAYANGSDVLFAESNINNKPTTWLGASRTVNSITFSNNCAAAFNVSVSAAQAGGTAATLTFLAGNSGITVQSGDTFSHSIGVSANPASGSDVILQGNLMVTNNGSGILTIQRPITSPSGTFGVTVNGTGVVLLSGPNSYAGDTIITAGTLRLGTGANVPDGAAKGNVFVDTVGTLSMNGQTETINGLSGAGIVDNLAGVTAVLTVGGNDQNSTFGGTIQSTGGELDLVKTGLGTLTLSGVNTYYGPTTIGAGKLVGVVGGSAASSTVTINATTAKLGVSITDNTKSWTAAGLTAAAGGLEFDFASVAPSGSVSPLIVAGAANFSAATPAVTVLGVNLSVGTFPLMTWGSLSGSAPSAVTLPAGVSGNLSVSGNTLNLNITSVFTALAKANNADNLNLTTSWTTGVVPGPADVAPWNSIVTAPNTTVLGANLTWAGIKIADPAGLVTINDGNTLTLGAAAKDIDMTSASADLSLNCPLVVGAANVWDVGPGRTLTLGNVVSGSSPITKQGGGVAILAGTNTFNAGLSLTAGTLNINSATALGATASTFTIAGGTIDNNSSGAIVLANNNPQAWNADVTFLGTTNLDLGAGAVTLDTNRTVTVNANTLTVGGVIGDGGGAFSLTKVGNGTLALTGANTFNGGLSLDAGTLTLAGANLFSAGVNLNFGTLNLNHPSALGTATLTFTTAGGIIGNTSGGLVTLNNNPQAWNADFTFNGPNDLDLGAGVVTRSANRIVTVNTSTLTVGGLISGTFTLQKSGGGILALNGLNTYTGQTIIQGGTLQANTVANAGVPSSLGASTGANSVIQIGNVSGAIGLEYTGNRPASTDRQIQVGNNGNGNNAPFILNNNTDSANTLTFSNPSFNKRATGAITSGARTLTLSGSNTGSNTIVGNIVNNNASAGGANNIVNLTKAGTGTWVLGGSNSYTGPTTINAGTLVVNGSLLADSAVTVNTGGTLSGSGTINGPVTVSGTGTLAPGGAVGTMTFGNDVAFATGAQPIFDCSSSPLSRNDQVVLNSASAILTGGGATITINQLAGVDTVAATDYLLFDLPGASGSAAGDFNPTPAWLPAAPANAANYAIVTEGKQVYLKFTAPPGANQLTIETKADGSGVLVGSQNVPAGNTVTAYAIERTAGGTFVTNQSAIWSLINLTGGTVNGDLVAAGNSKSATFTGHLVGSGQLRAGAVGLTSTKGGTLTVVAGPASQVRVETQPDGSGTLVPAQTLVPGGNVSGYAITRDAGGNFVANVSADSWSLENKLGHVADADLSAGGNFGYFTANNAGSATIHATSGALTPVDSGVLTVLADLLWNGSGANWDTNTAANWYAVPSYYNIAFANNFCTVTFDDNGVFGNPTVNLVGSLSPLSVTAAATGGNYTLAGTGKITGSGSLTNRGTSTLTLQTANDFTGGTTIGAGAGTLILSGNGSIQNSSPITMAAGTTLDASGRVDGTLTLNTNQVMQGNGLFNVTGTVTNKGTIKLKLTKTATTLTNDQLNVTGTLTYGSTLQLVVAANPALTTNDSFKVFSAAAYKGAFPTVTPGPGAGLVWNTNTLALDGILRIAASAVVATNPTNISYTFSGNTLTLTWPADHLGWYAQSNSVSVADTNYWFDIPGSQSATNLVITVNPAHTNVFYRMRLP